MSDIYELISRIDQFIKSEADAEENSLKDTLPDFPGKENIENYIEDFETTLAYLFLQQKNRYVDLFKAFTAKTDEETLQAILAFFQSEVFSYDVFIEQMKEESKKFLHMSVSEFCTAVMDALDKDVPFQVLSQRTLTWIEDWSEELSEILQLGTDNQVEKILSDAISNGTGIDVVERDLMELEGFSRDRARKTAITEILTASSVAHQESYEQSPSVKGKRWKHSGSKGITPRQNHMQLDGTVVPVDEPFTIPGSGEKAMFPRDPQLSAKERIGCHCVQGPEVDEDIFGLSAEEKQALREEALAELNASN